MDELVHEASKKRDIDRVNARNDFKSIASTAAGRRFIRALLAECGADQTGFIGDAHAMYFKEGKRSVGAWVKAQYAEYPELYIKMLKEEDL